MTLLTDINLIKSYEHATTSLKNSLYKSINPFLKKIESYYLGDSLEALERKIKEWIEELEFKGESYFAVHHEFIKLGWYIESGIEPISFIEFNITREEYFNTHNPLQESKKRDTIPNSLDLVASMHRGSIGA